MAHEAKPSAGAIEIVVGSFVVRVPRGEVETIAAVPAAEGDSVIGPATSVRILVAMRPVDFRKGIDGLAALVREHLGCDPFSGVIYVFRAKRANRIKLLFWDGTGVVLVSKRLEKNAFRWPGIADGVMRLTPAQLSAFDGLDWERREPDERQRVQVPYYEGVANHIGPGHTRAVVRPCAKR